MKPDLHRVFDLSALSLSGLCLAHCIALPVLAAMLPFLSSWLNAEWVHGVFAGFAVPLTVAALWSGRRHRLPAALIALATLGLGLLILGATEWLGPASNTPLTIVGALILATAHTWNWRRHQRAHLLERLAKPEDSGLKGTTGPAPLPADLG